MEEIENDQPPNRNVPAYDQKEDMNLIEDQDDNDQLINTMLDDKPNREVDNLLDELVEPELMTFVQNDPDAVELLKKCSALCVESKWDALKEYLSSIIDSNLNESNQDIKPNGKTFIKLFYLGVYNFKKEKYQESLINFLNCRKIYQHYQIDYNIALCDIKIGQLDNAIFYLESVSKQNKTFFFAYYNLIKIFLKKNNTNDAFLIYRDFSEIIKKEKDEEKKNSIDNDYRMTVSNFNTFKFFYKIGAECLFAKQLYQECVYAILEALKFNPDDPELWLLYGKVFIMKKNFEFSIPLIQKALEIRPDYQEAQRLLEFLIENKD